VECRLRQSSSSTFRHPFSFPCRRRRRRLSQSRIFAAPDRGSAPAFVRRRHSDACLPAPAIRRGRIASVPAAAAILTAT
jgi:hypothetical protein